MNSHTLWHFKYFATNCDIFTHRVFRDLYNASVNAKTNSDHSPISLQLAHSFAHECIHPNMQWMESQLICHSLWHFKWIVTSCDIFTHHAFQDLYNVSVIHKLTQIMPLSHCSWHIHSHMNAFTHKCITCNPNWIVTLYDILNNLSSVVTFSHHVFQDLYNASVDAKTNSDHSPISMQLAHSFTHECIHANMHYMQPQLNSHSS